MRGGRTRKHHGPLVHFDSERVLRTHLTTGKLSCVVRSWYRNRSAAAEHLSPRGGYPDMLDKFRQVSSALHIGPVNSAMNNGMTNAYGFQASEENGAGR
ncbi:hypothetical protein LMG19146_03277 [Xanthomonas arboricola pv. fragariae]|nr:hypothetical protein LMG19146_03277 [Xanthomonas arboricola pv. fragariae]